MDLTHAVARTLIPKPPRAAPNIAAKLGAPPVKPVFQLNALPQPLDPTTFAGALSPGNPGGALAPLAAFRDLVDAVPAMTRFYSPGPMSTEQAWGNFINGASVKAGAGFATLALSSSQQNFSTYALAGLTPAATSWRPVYATPDNWWDLTRQSFTPVTVDPNAPGGPNGAYSTIGAGNEAQDMQWRDPRSGATAPLASGTTLKSIRFNAFEVVLRRPWLDPSLLSNGAIYLGGEPSGLYSSGQLNDNDGVMPLLSTSFYLATDVQIEADWSASDLQRLEQAQTNRTPLALGAFALAARFGARTAGLTLKGDTVSSPLCQIVAWVSALTPLCPSMGG
jgi:hypothetical protein